MRASPLALHPSVYMASRQRCSLSALSFGATTLKPRGLRGEREAPGHRSERLGNDGRGQDMSEAMGQGGGDAALRPGAIGELLGAAFQLYRRHWQRLLAIAAVVVVPLTVLQYVLGHWLRLQGEVTRDQWSRPRSGRRRPPR